MGWTKGQIIDQAYDELALAGYVFDITPEERQSALRRLDAMVASWINGGLVLTYTFSPESPYDASLLDATGLPLVAVEAAYTGLALRIAASKGKQVPVTLKAAAKSALDALMSANVRQNMPQVQLRSNTPRGAGAKAAGQGLTGPFLDEPTTDPLQETDGSLIFTEV